MDFDFVLNDKIARRGEGQKYEFWVPIDKNPQLRSHERKDILYKEGIIASVHLVKPAFLISDSLGKIAFQECNELKYFFLAMCLKNSPYLLIYDAYQKNSFMTEYLGNKSNHKIESTFYMDLFYNPNFGTILPKQILFEKINLKSIPETAVVFREIN